MKQKIGIMKSPEEPISDLDVVFVAIYNLIYEKIEQEPHKGIVVSKGNPNERRAKWDEIMRLAHELEDYFMLRKLRTGCKTCGECIHWKSISVTSPHLGMCTRTGKGNLHRFNGCKEFKEAKR